MDKLSIVLSLKWLWFKFVGFGCCFQSELNNLQKRSKLIEKHKKNTVSGRFFEVYSILAEKQRLKPKNSNSLKFSASFDTHLDPSGAILVEILQFLHFVLIFGNSGTPRLFCVFKIKSEITLIGLRLKKGYHYSFSV